MFQKYLTKSGRLRAEILNIWDSLCVLLKPVFFQLVLSLSENTDRCLKSSQGSNLEEPGVPHRQLHFLLCEDNRLGNETV